MRGREVWSRRLKNWSFGGTSRGYRQLWYQTSVSFRACFSFRNPHYRHLCPHADFQSRVGSPEALYFKELPGRPLPNMQHNAQRCRASSRNIHASCHIRGIAYFWLARNAPIQNRTSLEPMFFTSIQNFLWLALLNSILIASTQIIEKLAYVVVPVLPHERS